MSPSVGSRSAAGSTTTTTTGTDAYLHHKTPHIPHLSLSSSYPDVFCSADNTLAISNAATKEKISTGQSVISSRSFVQVKSPDDHEELELVDVWATTIPAKIATKVISILKQQLPLDPHSLLHLRRLVKMSDQESVAGLSSDQIYLSLLVCSVNAVPSESEINRLLAPMKELIPENSKNDQILVPYIKQAPKYPALTKQQSKEWSEGTWPIMWRGNPHAVILELPEDEEIKIMKHFDELARLIESAKLNNEVPIATMIIDPTTSKVVVSAYDVRNTTGNPLNHSIMACVAKVAELERARRMEHAKNGDPQTPQQLAYLCHNLELITTHEPCSMCCMALVHSRISRLVYIKQMPRSGGLEPSSGPGYSIHRNKLLNWRFFTWKYNGAKDARFPNLEENINA
ncbi:cytidine deaminase-like protein [Dipodascopsis uninucleata]